MVKSEAERSGSGFGLCPNQSSTELLMKIQNSEAFHTLVPVLWGKVWDNYNVLAQLSFLSKKLSEPFSVCFAVDFVSAV